MTRDDRLEVDGGDYRARIETEPLTVNQLGRIRAEFRRLGFDEADRAARLRVTAALAGIPGRIDSTKDLTEAEAGRVVRLLTGCRTPGQLYALVLAAPEPEPRPRTMLARLLAWLRGTLLPYARPNPRGTFKTQVGNVDPEYRALGLKGPFTCPDVVSWVRVCGIERCETGFYGCPGWAV